MLPRSYEEAQAQRAVEVAEIDTPLLEAALFQVTSIVSQEGGEEYLPIYERLRNNWEAARQREAMIEEARQMARQLRPNRRPPRGRRAAR